MASLRRGITFEKDELKGLFAAYRLAVRVLSRSPIREVIFIYRYKNSISSLFSN